MSTIIFDFDGVLADTLDDILRFGQQACDELGVEHRVVPADLTELEVMSFATFGQACGVPEGLLEEFVRRCGVKFAGQAPPAIYAGMREVVSELAGPHSLAVVTGNTAGNVEAFLQEHGLQGCVRLVYGVDTPGSKAEKIRMATSQLAADGEAVFMVGDSASDMLAARQAGVISIAVGWGHQTVSVLLRASPDYLARSPEDLIEITKVQRQP
jgi:phosphoglycolate phosphatase